ncbi:MAG: hypothetical protein ACEPOW_14690 [Bacteroidales bacterium]
MSSNNEDRVFNYKKPSKQLDDFIHIYWEHKNLTDKVQNLTIFPDSFFKLILLYKKEKLIAFFMTGLWTNEFEFFHPPDSIVYGIKFKILSPEFILQDEIASIFSSHKDLSPDFLNIDKLKFQGLDSFGEQMDQLFKEKLEHTTKKIKSNKLQLSQLLYSVGGNIIVEEVSNQINWSTRQINRYLNKYLGVSLKTYLNIQKCYSSYFHIRDGKLYPENEYFDQSHFIREIKKYTGKTPSELHKNKNDRFIQLKNIQRK